MNNNLLMEAISYVEEPIEEDKSEDIFKIEEVSQKL